MSPFIILLLISVISAFAEIKDCSLQGRELPSVAKPEISKPAFLERVSVFNSPIQINGPRPVSNIDDFVSGERTIKPQCLIENGTSAERIKKLLWYRRHYQRHILISHANDCDLSVTDDLICGRLPRVFYKHGNTWDACFRGLRGVQHRTINDRRIIWQHVSPQLASTITDHYPYRDDQRQKLKQSGDARKDGDF